MGFFQLALALTPSWFTSKILTLPSKKKQNKTHTDISFLNCYLTPSFLQLPNVQFWRLINFVPLGVLHFNTLFSPLNSCPHILSVSLYFLSHQSRSSAIFFCFLSNKGEFTYSFTYSFHFLPCSTNDIQ